jgi:hypothetical protein
VGTLRALTLNRKSRSIYGGLTPVSLHIYQNINISKLKFITNINIKQAQDRLAWARLQALKFKYHLRTSEFAAAQREAKEDLAEALLDRALDATDKHGG